MNEFSVRINQIADFYGVKRPADFAKKAGFSHQTSSNYLSGKRIPTADSLKSIKQTFDQINAGWLLTGEGEMLKTDPSPDPAKEADQPSKLYEIILKQQETIAKLTDRLLELTDEPKPKKDQ